ncbi:putative protein TOXD [Glarea lozoyensis 74030]|uniref:Alcohol dehydrogenase-like N-terminal domain-containing protein n=1 Tax=Glarea lozoyensis (strain ATCC 74030 / MF5533) TaxID=1104152 RepID=H0EW82_GLAL7|nr:putative protein TOXD [Glarea lozoyensis 74030]
MASESVTKGFRFNHTGIRVAHLENILCCSQEQNLSKIHKDCPMDRFVKLCFTVPDIDATMKHFKSINVNIVKDAGTAENQEVAASFLGCFPSAEVKCEIESAPIPEPKDKQVLIKVVVSGSNPKDWKVPTWAAEYNGPDNDSWQTKAKSGMNHGDDIAGVVEKVGKDVIAFKTEQKGDRVGAFHEMQAPGGSYAEYGLAWEHTTFHLPASTSFEEAATIPLAALTAAVAVFKNLKLPTPWLPATESTPFIVYGASSSVGSYAIKLARNSNIHPIIAVAGKGTPHVESLLDRSKGDAVFDYRKGTEETIKGIRAHLKSGKYGEVRHGLDPGIGEPSKQVLTEIVVSDGAINLVLPSDWDTGKIAKTKTTVGSVHTVDNSGSGDNHNLGLVTCRWFTEALEKGTFTAHPYEVRPGGLEAVQQALQDLKDGKNSASKYVFRIADTPGL